MNERSGRRSDSPAEKLSTTPTRPGRRIFDFDLRGPGGVAARAMIGGRVLDDVAADLRDRFDPALLGDLAALQRALRDALFRA